MTQETRSEETRSEETVEVVVVGAGFAGLAAAQLLGRAQREVLLLGAGPTRNAEAEHAHNVLTRDGTPPGELIRLGMAEVVALPTVRIEEVQVLTVEPGDGERLRVRAADGRVIQAGAILLATGARDVLPQVAGLPALWGRRAHSCPFCDGEAYAGRRLMVVAEEARAVHSRAILAGWTDQVVVADPDDIAELIEVDGDVVARLRNGGQVTADGVFVGVTPVPRLDCVAGMALARRGPYLAVDGDGRTSHPHLWAAGDCAWVEGASMPGGQVIASMAAGARSAALIVLDRIGVQMPDAPPVEAPRTDAPSAAAYWDARYGQHDRMWRGRPNERLVEEVSGMTPGTALDLGCGEGGDAVWLAEQGWQVLAVDVSATALARGSAVAAERGVAGAIDWQRHDLASSFPEGQFDMVNAAYLLSPLDFPRAAVLRAAAAAVAPGGTLLVLGHASAPPWAEHHTHDFETVEEVLAGMDLPPGEWTVETAGEFDRGATGPDGAEATITDNVLRLRRLAPQGAVHART